MSDKITFVLAEEYDSKTFGGSFALRDGSLFDVAAALKDGSGKIQTDDEHLITALDVYHGVVREGAPKSAPSKSSSKSESEIA
jgi:hypothetical protein